MSIEITNPWTGQVDYRYDYQSEAVVEQILARSKMAFPIWSALALEQRGKYLLRVAEQLRKHRERIADIMSVEVGKLTCEALAEIGKSAGACEYYAQHAGNYLHEQFIPTEATRSYVTYEPLGCVFAVMPWNFPIWQVFRFLAPVLMAGNVALLKHATNVPRCADVIVEIIESAGLPQGVFGVLHINNEGAAKVIADPRVHAITLTGSEKAGRPVAATAGQHLKKCVMELGGSDPFIVLDDADLDKTIPFAIASRFNNAGQTCIAAKRFIVTVGIADAFVERLIQAASQLNIGDPHDANTHLAPMARADLRDELHQQVVKSIQAGATVRLGCEPGMGASHYPASILDHVKPGMPAYSEELFGPVASVIRVKDANEAIAVANDTSFGLGASLWTSDIARGEILVKQINAGACFVNAIVRSDVRLPFGGTKASGFGRELAAHGIQEFMNIKTVYVG